MNLALVRKHRKRQKYWSALLAKNPVLVLGLDLPFVIACSMSLRIAVALSIEMFIVHLLTMITAMITVRHLPFWSRMLVNVGVSTITMTFARQLITSIFPDIMGYVGVYVYLMAVNGLTIYQATQISRRRKPGPVLVSAFVNALAFSIIMLAISLFREYFGNGSLWGIPLNNPYKLSGFLLPFSGFILVGFLLALMKYFNKKLLALTLAESIRQDARYTPLS